MTLAGLKLAIFFASTSHVLIFKEKQLQRKALKTKLAGLKIKIQQGHITKKEIISISLSVNLKFRETTCIIYCYTQLPIIAILFIYDFVSQNCGLGATRSSLLVQSH